MGCGEAEELRRGEAVRVALLASLPSTTLLVLVTGSPKNHKDFDDRISFFRRLFLCYYCPIMTKIELDRILNKIKKELAKRPEILAAYLYGSHAKGYAREGSDIDIAIMLDHGLTPEDVCQVYDYQFRLESALHQATGHYGIEVLVTQLLSYPLKYNATIGGRLLYSRDDRKRLVEEARTSRVREDLGDLFEERLRCNILAAKKSLGIKNHA